MTHPTPGKCVSSLTGVGIDKDPPESPEASESQAEAYTCDTCRRPVTLHDYSEPGPWKWYDCEFCGESATWHAKTEQAASESNPTASFCDPGGEVEPKPARVEDPSPEETAGGPCP